jgi:hypothetical protein
MCDSFKPAFKLPRHGIRIGICANPDVILVNNGAIREANTPKKFVRNGWLFCLYINPIENSRITIDFIVIHDCARKFIQSTLWPGYGESFFGKNIRNPHFFAGIETINSDFSSRVCI